MQTIDDKQLRLDCTNLLCRAEWHIAKLRRHYAKHHIKRFVPAAKALIEELGEFAERHFSTLHFNTKTEQIFLLLKNTLRLQEEMGEYQFMNRWFNSDIYPYTRAEFRKLYREYVRFVGGFLNHCSDFLLVKLDDSTQVAFREGTLELLREFRERSDP